MARKNAENEKSVVRDYEGQVYQQRKYKRFTKPGEKEVVLKSLQTQRVKSLRFWQYLKDSKV